MKATHNILEEFEMKHGLEIDLDEGWHKNANRQFGGSPGRGFAELIQNLIDSYPDNIPMGERKGIINTTPYSISIIDFGTGLSLEKIRLIKTLGGTDKADNSSKIGQFGMGFFSIFNKRLGTKSVVVTTRCEGYVIQIAFTVIHPDKRPEVTIRELEEEILYSTKIEVNFDNRESPGMCIGQAGKALTYYPCNITINREPFESVWEIARNKDLKHFKSKYCDGFFKNNTYRNWITVLCKYEYIMELTGCSLFSGSGKPWYDLRDYENKQTPYLPSTSAVVNCNQLNLTISRDSFYLNYNYEKMMETLNAEFYKLLNNIQFELNTQLVLANLYILQREIRNFMNNKNLYNPELSEKRNVIQRLAEAPVLRITGMRNPVSLTYLKNLVTNGVPLFYSPNKFNLQWLGGNFRHDFILLPERCYIENGAPDFYGKMLNCFFDDVINLDEIQGNNVLISKLVDRGIVSKEALAPNIKFIGEKRLNGAEAEFLDQINRMFEKPDIKDVIETNLYLLVKNIRVCFFEIQKEGAYISTGLFDNNFKPISDDFISNLRETGDKASFYRKPADVLLGLQKNHPLIKELIAANDPCKLYYALTYIAHELVYCQKLLAPHSPFFHVVKEKLTAQMRKALMTDLLGNAS
jgi:hypothetical protein